MVTSEMIRRIPKAELHYHLDGGLRPKTIIELAAEYGIELPATKPAELTDWFHRGADRKNLGLYMQGFDVTVSVLQTEAALERVRAKAMAMHNSDDISDATAVLFSELEKLGIITLRIGFFIVIHGTNHADVWTATSMSSSKHTGAFSTCKKLKHRQGKRRLNWAWNGFAPEPWPCRIPMSCPHWWILFLKN